MIRRGSVFGVSVRSGGFLGFCVREFMKTKSATAVQRAFRLLFNIQPPARKNIHRWNHQFEQIGCL